MTGVIYDARAIDLGDEVRVESIDRNGFDVTFTLKKDEYNVAREILINGIGVDQLSNVISPHDIVGYLYEANPEAQNVMVDVEAQRALRQQKKDIGRTIAYAGGFATIIMAMVIFYLAIVKDPAAAADVASSAASGVTVV